ncbi:MAG: hypothetical protein ACLSHC_00735 [Bilophila wadsworthia]
MNVWIWSNKARVVIVAECNGYTPTPIWGQLRRFSLPSENPWPLACLTDGYTSLRQYTTWHDAITSTGSRDADLHRRNLAFVRRGSFPGNDLFLLSRLSPDLQAGRRMDLALRHLPHDQPAGLVERL